MGIDITNFETILLSLKYIENKKNLLTLGRQQFHIDIFDINNLLIKYNLSNLCDKYNINDYCENFFIDLGFQHVDSIDNNDYEKATIIHNMNYSIENKLKKKYDFILDGGTIEHIYNTPQVCENIINLLEIDGILCSITCNNNFSGHGFYQFSPEFFQSTFNPKYGMKIQMIYLVENASNFDNWINVNIDNKKLDNGRNEYKFNSLKSVYIITIAKKISDDRKYLTIDYPNQYSYEMIDWK